MHVSFSSLYIIEIKLLEHTVLKSLSFIFCVLGDGDRFHFSG